VGTQVWGQRRLALNFNNSDGNPAEFRRGGFVRETTPKNEPIACGDANHGGRGRFFPLADSRNIGLTRGGFPVGSPQVFATRDEAIWELSRPRLKAFPLGPVFTYNRWPPPLHLPGLDGHSPAEIIYVLKRHTSLNY